METQMGFNLKDTKGAIGLAVLTLITYFAGMDGDGAAAEILESIPDRLSVLAYGADWPTLGGAFAYVSATLSEQAAKSTFILSPITIGKGIYDLKKK